ncbi:MAG TPA: gamma carbonic anhydrase family protein [Longimicrobiales bacterium]|jgi:carbonic anhydrase/acetyltransferase-like protein (isoleucine patch superfamily)
MAIILPFNGRRPVIAIDAFVAPSAVLIGNVVIGPQASIWFGAVLRGDDPDNGIVVGARTSVQDNCVIHVGAWQPTVIGEDCTIGHGAKFESCAIGDGTVVGMNAVILQEARIGARCVVGANALVPQGHQVPDLCLVAGVPATIRKRFDGSEPWLAGGGQHYVQLSRAYLAAGIGTPDLHPPPPAERPPTR